MGGQKHARARGSSLTNDEGLDNFSLEGREGIAVLTHPLRRIRRTRERIYASRD